MSEPSVFLGLVTHKASRFNVAGAAASRGHGLVAALAVEGIPAELLVSDSDDYEADTYPLPPGELARGARYWSDLEYRWRRYLADGGGHPSRSALADRAWAAAMTAKRLTEAMRIESARKAAIRLINIDLSHLRVLEAAQVTGRSWTLVLEDDAGYADTASTAAALARVVRELEDGPVQFANLSESISLDALGVQGIVTPPGQDRAVWPCRRPVTNTVCANLYRTAFADMLAAGIRAQGLLPVAPIDWRVNEQLMRMHAGGWVTAESCVWIRPGLFVQGSMHGPI